MFGTRVGGRGGKEEKMEFFFIITFFIFYLHFKKGFMEEVTFEPSFGR